MPSYLIVEGMRVGLLSRLGEGVPGGGLPEAVYLRSSIDLSLSMWFEVLFGQIYSLKPFVCFLRDR